jgi:Tfp pilus assembly protein PilF
VIELMLQAEQALETGRLDQAEKIYWQVVESDARNAIAVVGLARVAIERGDEQTAREFTRRALELDPDNVSAIRLTSRLARGR